MKIGYATHGFVSGVAVLSAIGDVCSVASIPETTPTDATNSSTPVLDFASAAEVVDTLHISASRVFSFSHEDEWTPVDENRFRRMAASHALGLLRGEALENYKHLRQLRREREPSRTGAEIIMEQKRHRAMAALLKALDDLRET